MAAWCCLQMGKDGSCWHCWFLLFDRCSLDYWNSPWQETYVAVSNHCLAPAPISHLGSTRRQDVDANKTRATLTCEGSSLCINRHGVDILTENFCTIPIISGEVAFMLHPTVGESWATTLLPPHFLLSQSCRFNTFVLRLCLVTCC